MNDWLSQIPIVPLVAVVVLVLAFALMGRGKGKSSGLVAQKIAEGAKVVDVRSKGEFAGGHFPGAINIPVETIASKLKLFGPIEGPIVVYCAAGSRAAQAVSQLKAAGYTDVTSAGGLANMPKTS